MLGLGAGQEGQGVAVVHLGEDLALLHHQLKELLQQTIVEIP